MSDYSQGPGWWEASDDKWYPPEQAPGPSPADPPGWEAPAYEPPTSASPGYGPPAYGPGAGYGPPGPGYAPVGGFATYGGPGPYGSGLPSVQGLATASLVLGVIALVMFWCWFIAVVLAVIGLPLGLVAQSRISNGSASSDGRGAAMAGIICSGIALVLSIGFIVALVAV